MRANAAQRGQMLPLVGIGVILLIAAAGLAVDTGYHQYQQRLQQTATDSAALAGAAEKIAGTSVVASAQKDAANNGFTDNRSGANCDANTTVCVQVNNPPGTGPYAANNNAVEVVITARHPTFFERIFGTSTVPVSTRAVATVTSNQNGCIFLLSTTADSNFNKSTVNAPGCTIVSNNATVNFNQATVTAAAIDCVGTCSGNPTPAPRHIIPASDPCPSITGCAYLASHAPSTGGCSSFSSGGGNVTVNPGCYSTLDLHKASQVTFNSGLFVITGQLDAHGLTGTPAGVNGANVTFYVTGSGALDFHSSTLSLSAPTSGDYNAYSQGEANVLFYQAPSDTNGPNFQTANCGGVPTCVQTLNGLLYFPTADVNYNKTEGGYNVLVFGSGNFNMSNNAYTGPAGGGSILSQAVLGE